MSKSNQSPTNEEYFVFPVPEGLDEDEELIINVLPYDQGIAILDAERLRRACETLGYVWGNEEA